MKVSIDTNELQHYKKRLEKMGRSDFPVVVRQTLNEAAFDMKQKTVPRVFARTFIMRRDFIGKQTVVNKCINTFAINDMMSEAGISNKREIGKRMALQEDGGVINDRAVPMNSTRAGGNRQSKQLATYYYKKFKKLPNGHSPSQKGIQVKRRKKTTYIKTDNKLMAVHAGGKWETMYKLEGSIRLKRKAFVAPAGLESGEKINMFFVNFAKKRIKK